MKYLIYGLTLEDCWFYSIFDFLFFINEDEEDQEDIEDG